MIIPLVLAAFEAVALVDSLDFARGFDIETDEGNVGVLEHVLLSHATDVWWRDKGGGRLRYPSAEEAWPVTEYPFDRHILPNEDVFGHLRLDTPNANAFPLIRRECERRGIGFGIHTTWEETHNLISLTSNWTLNHPQFWGRVKDAKPWMGCCALSYPEVVEHKLRLVDERLAFKPGIVFLDFCRDGSYHAGRECVKPTADEWRRRYGCEPPGDARDPRWLALVSEKSMDYLRRFAAKCHAQGCRFAVGFKGFTGEFGKDSPFYRQYAVDWEELAADGTIDAVVVMGAKYDPRDPWGSTERVYRQIMAHRGKADVYFHVSQYNWYGEGIGGYAKAAKVGEPEAARRLVEIAKAVGGRGVVMECVDHGNYTPAICEAIGQALGKGERTLCDGVNPAVSPDGRKVAFQRLDGGVFKLGLLDLASGRTDWIEEGPGMAAYPSWSPSGALVYTWGYDPKTSYQATKEGIKTCYGLRVWEKGVKRDITTGRCRDYTPAFSPDGRSVYFASTRWVRQTSKSFSTASTSMIGVVGADGGEPKVVVDSPNGHNTGVVQPAVSPDGRVLIWGHLQNFFGYWRIYGARLSATGEQTEWCPVSPDGLVALAPRWHPDGRLICFTGYLKDDPDWGVWVEDVTTGKVRRICDGQNPSFSFDGKSIVYDRDRKVRIRPFGAADLPDRSLSAKSNPQAEPERVLLSRKGPFVSTTALPVDDRFAFGRNKTFFVRVKVKWDGQKGMRHYAIGDYAANALGIQLYQNVDLWFATRDSTGKFCGVCRKFDIGPGEHVFTGIRAGRMLYLSVDGKVPVAAPVSDPISLDGPRRFLSAKDLHAGESVEEITVGTGWPTDVPKTRKREDLFK